MIVDQSDARIFPVSEILNTDVLRKRRGNHRWGSKVATVEHQHKTIRMDRNDGSTGTKAIGEINKYFHLPLPLTLHCVLKFKMSLAR